MQDVLGQAILNFYHKSSKAKLWIHNKYGPKEEMPVEIYFRDLNNLTALELIAIKHCKGKILDIGAGAGSIAKLLQEKRLDVTALEISPILKEVMKLRGVSKIVQEDIYRYDLETFDTLLLLMNGIGLVGSLSGFKRFLKHAKKIINPGGQLIFDSSNVAYLYEGDIPEMANYYGEILYQYEYKKQKTDWFKWLYIDIEKLIETANLEGFQTEILFEDENDQFLARLVVKQ